MGTCATCTREACVRAAAGDGPSAVEACDCWPEDDGPRFPMWVLPLATFLEGSGPPKGHQELLAEGRLVQKQEHHKVVFVSHQWLGFTHPDPKGAQLQHLREALSLIKSGEVEPRLDWHTEMYFPISRGSLQNSLGESAVLWYDYWSIPQPTLAEEGAEEATHEEMVAAVCSIPAYVRHASIFTVLAPDLPHADTGQPCSFRTWGRRGWCRLEMTSYALRGPGASDELLLVRSGRQPSILGSLEWSFGTVGTGEFTVDADRDMLYPVVRDLIDRYLQQPASSNDSQGLAKRRYILAHRRILLEGFPIDGRVREDVESFLARYHFSSLLDRGEVGFGPLHCAALEGQDHILEEAIVKGGANVDVVTEESVSDMMTLKGMSPLSYASLRGVLASAETLLRLKANPHHSVGSFKPLHFACVGGAMTPWKTGHVDIVNRLLLYRAGLEDVASSVDCTPLVCSAIGMRAEIAKHLLSLRANPNYCGSMGSALHFLSHAGSGSPELVPLLVEARADVDARVQARSMGSRVIFAASRLGILVGSCTHLVGLFANMEGATPLLLAAHMRHEELCEALLSARADPELRNARGLSALDLADCKSRCLRKLE